MSSQSSSLSTPVVFLIFNRPDTTARVFAEIARARPSRLFVIADGPRAHRSGEAEKCAQTRAIVENVDWDCAVTRDFSDVNLGCRRRVAGGLDNVFAQVERAIILEDDCLPDPSFFPFCEELLARYENDARVMHISGDNFQRGRRTADSYYFSRYPHCWGWATWRRAWSRFDMEMAEWPSLRQNGWLSEMFGDRAAADIWTYMLDKAYDGRVDSWATRWAYTCWRQGGLSILPDVNLISNIGFGDEATHTTEKNSDANVPTEAMPFPLRHPSQIARSEAADRFTQKTHYGVSQWQAFQGRLKRAARRLRRPASVGTTSR